MQALITVNNICYFQRMLELARKLNAHGAFRAALYLHGFREFEPHHRELCAAAGVEVVGEPPGRWFHQLTRFAALGEAATTLRLMRMIRSEIRRIGAAVVIMPEDSPDYGGPAITAAAHAEGVPVAVLATLGSAPLDELANIYMYFDELAGGGLRQRLVGAIFPEWRYSHRGKRVLRSPVERILVQKALKIAAARPWVYYSGHADVVLFDSEEVRAFSVDHGLDASRLRVTGFVEHDIMAGKLHDTRARRQLDGELGLAPDKPILLLALVQAHYINGAPKCDFQHYPDMVEFIVKSVAARSRFNVVVSLHPSMSYDEYRYIEDWGVKIARSETVGLVPLCDVYVASGSSTINWAIACGKPVINYDVYRYDLSAYKAAPAVLTVQEQQDFIAALARVDDPAQLSALTARQAAAADRWGKLDGHSFERIVSTLSELVGRKDVPLRRAV